MKFQNIKPVTPSQRGLIKIKNTNLKSKPLLKKHIKGQKTNAGRNIKGKITVHHKGGGHKQRYRFIDFERKNDSTSITCSIEYDPNRTAHIASLYNLISKKYSYIIAPESLSAGDIVKSGPNAEVKLGHSLPIAKIPVGSLIYNVSPKLNKPGQISKSAGTFAYLVEKTSNFGRIKLSSGKQKILPLNSYASIGSVSNELFFLTTIGKAGRSRWLNKRPTVRGVAMNPIDHPHGGGEGRKSGKGLTPWGMPNLKSFRKKSKNIHINIREKCQDLNGKART